MFRQRDIDPVGAPGVAPTVITATGNTPDGIATAGPGTAAVMFAARCGGRED